jgi:hypothetical protein
VRQLSRRGQRRGGRKAGNGGRGRMGGPKSAGPTGHCICPNCNTTINHQTGIPCYSQTCPNCGIKMTRK